MYRTRSTSTMGSLGRDHVARIPIDLRVARPPSASVSTISSSSSAPYGTARILINGSSSTNGVSTVRCRIDSDSTPSSDFSEIDHHHHHQSDPYVVVQKQAEVMTSDFDGGVRKWPSPPSSSSEFRETGSILKKPEFNNSQTLNNDKSKRGSTPQGRRRVRFTNNVAMYRFDSDGVDSAYSSSECERLYAPPVGRKTVPNRYATATVVIPGNSLSRIKVSSEDEYDVEQRSLNGRRALDEKLLPPPPGYHQTVRGPQVLQGTPNGSLYLRKNFDRTRSQPSVQWLGRSSPTLSSSSSASSSQKIVPANSVGSSSSSLKSTSYVLVRDHVTQEKKLVITAKLSDPLHPNDITIKANKNGSKIRIVSSKATTTATHQAPSIVQVSRHQINEQMVLPVRVDPYKLTARLDTTGSLLIEAPCTS